jgi:hypothetical protein
MKLEPDRGWWRVDVLVLYEVTVLIFTWRRQKETARNLFEKHFPHTRQLGWNEVDFCSLEKNFKLKQRYLSLKHLTVNVFLAKLPERALSFMVQQLYPSENYTRHPQNWRLGYYNLSEHCRKEGKFPIHLPRISPTKRHRNDTHAALCNTLLMVRTRNGTSDYDET